MLFNSYIFIFAFLPVTLFGYFLLNKFKLLKSAQAFLVMASLLFYAYFNFSYLWIIIASILFNFAVNKILHLNVRQTIRKMVLVVGLLCNLGLFVYFKYSNFFIENINRVFGTDYFLGSILLPLGISFFTFQQVSYIIDSYKKEVPNYSFLNYATFVAFFPQLIAGPIVLHKEIVPQFADNTRKKFNFDNFSKGLKAFAFGLAKKVLIADLFGQVVAIGYNDISALNTTSALLLMFSYTIQIYFDFSGYCDMATGLGLMFNISIPQNFNSPYKALTITDFWKRWHITLTRFFRKYLYYPLGGNRRGWVRTYTNIFIVFVVSGFWHGANWTFVLWGVLHGLASILTRVFDSRIKKLHPAFSWLMTFAFVNIAWIFFRAPSIGHAVTIIKTIVKCDFGGIPTQISDIFSFDLLKNIALYLGGVFTKFASLPNNILMALCVVLAIAAILVARNTNQRIESFKPTAISSVVVILLLVLSIISLSGVSTFLYFNF